MTVRCSKSVTKKKVAAKAAKAAKVLVAMAIKKTAVLNPVSVVNS